MRILLSPQFNNNEKIEYSFGADIITATYKGITDIFDFSALPDGELQMIDLDGNVLITTILELNPICRAYRINGVLSVEILNFITSEASNEERFPEWLEV